MALAFAAIQPATAAPAGPQTKELRARGARTIAGPKASPLKMPSDAAVSGDGSLYVLDGVNNRVVVFDADGAFRSSFGKQGSGHGELLFPLGIAAAADGTIYVADSGNRRVQIFTGEGKPVRIVPLPQTASGVAPDPTDVALDLTGARLFIADNDNHRLLVYDLKDRAFEAVWGGPGRRPLEFRFPFLVDTTADGYLLVVEPINTRVQVLNSRGKFVGFLGAWGVRPGQLFRPKGVAAYGDRIFVSDSYLGRIQEFDLRGRFFGVLADTQGKPLTFDTPTGITADEQRKRLYIVELQANRVRRVDLE